MDVIPFQGYRYNPDIVGNAAACIAPPYDVIDTEQQDDLYERNPFNIVRLIRGKALPNDGDADNVYTRAAAHLQDFFAQQALVPDETERLYAYTQDFVIAGQSYRRSGFVGLGKLEAYGGGIKPHEQTLAGPKADRLNLTRAIKTQVGQIFMLYSEPEKTIDAILDCSAAGKALLSHVDEDEVTHRLFAIADPADVETVQKAMKDRSVFIADGHHRYETALNYFAETKNPRAAYQLMTFVNTHNDGLIVLPTHRLIHHVKDFDKEVLLEAMREQFDIARLAYSDIVEKREKLKEMQQVLHLEIQAGNHASGIYFNDDAFYVATLRDAATVKQISGDYSDAWRRLDVSILHKLILEKRLGIDEAALTAQTNCDYIKDFGDAAEKALNRVDAGEAQALFFMNPTRIEEVEAVALAGEKMPQKSTFFFPKIFSGLVLNVLER